MKKINKLLERLKIILNKKWDNPFYEECDEDYIHFDTKITVILASLCIVVMSLNFLSEWSWDNLFNFFLFVSFIVGCLYSSAKVYKERFGYFPWDRKAP